MSLQGLLSVTIGVPNVDETAAYYTDFGLTPGGGWFSTADGGRQLRRCPGPSGACWSCGSAPTTRTTSAVSRRPGRARRAVHHNGTRLVAAEPVTGARVDLDVAPRTRQGAIPAPPTTARAGSTGRTTGRPGTRPDRVRPRKLGHVVLGSTDYAAIDRVLHRGPRLQDQRPDQGRRRVHALLDRPPQRAGPGGAGELPAPHLLAGRRRRRDRPRRVRMLEGRPERHVWGLGRHYAGSNFFWYLKDPAGNFSEYYSDMDCIIDDQLWKPEVWRGRGACSPGARRRPRPSCIPRTSRP